MSENRRVTELVVSDRAVTRVLAVVPAAVVAVCVRVLTLGSPPTALRAGAAAVVAAPMWTVRALLWGLMRPHAVELRTRHGRVRPLALVGAADDDDVHRMIRALLVRCGTRLMPSQRPIDG